MIQSLACLNSPQYITCEVAKKTHCLFVNVRTWKSSSLHSILNSVRKYWWIHEQIIDMKMLLWCTCSKKQRSKMLSTNISDLICILTWNICSSDGNVLQCCPFSALFLYLLFQAEMLHAQSSGQWMHRNSTAHIHKVALHSIHSGGCSLLLTVYHIVLWSLPACCFPKAQ